MAAKIPLQVKNYVVEEYGCAGSRLQIPSTQGSRSESFVASREHIATGRTDSPSWIQPKGHDAHKASKGQRTQVLHRRRHVHLELRATLLEIEASYAKGSAKQLTQIQETNVSLPKQGLTDSVRSMSCFKPYVQHAKFPDVARPYFSRLSDSPKAHLARAKSTGSIRSDLHDIKSQTSQLFEIADKFSDHHSDLSAVEDCQEPSPPRKVEKKPQFSFKSSSPFTGLRKLLSEVQKESNKIAAVRLQSPSTFAKKLVTSTSKAPVKSSLEMHSLQFFGKVNGINRSILTKKSQSKQKPSNSGSPAAKKPQQPQACKDSSYLLTAGQIFHKKLDLRSNFPSNTSSQAKLTGVRCSARPNSPSNSLFSASRSKMIWGNFATSKPNLSKMSNTKDALGARKQSIYATACTEASLVSSGGMTLANSPTKQWVVFSTQNDGTRKSLATNSQTKNTYNLFREESLGTRLCCNQQLTRSQLAH